MRPSGKSANRPRLHCFAIMKACNTSSDVTGRCIHRRLTSIEEEEGREEDDKEEVEQDEELDELSALSVSREMTVSGLNLGPFSLELLRREDVWKAGLYWPMMLMNERGEREARKRHTCFVPARFSGKIRWRTSNPLTARSKGEEEKEDEERADSPNAEELKTAETS